jgi:hypothetical protein
MQKYQASAAQPFRPFRGSRRVPHAQYGLRSLRDGFASLVCMSLQLHMVMATQLEGSYSGASQRVLLLL